MGFFDYSLSIKDRIISDFGITLYMLVVSAIFAGILGLILGVIMVVTDKGRILENKAIYSILDKLCLLYTLTLPTTARRCRSRWSTYH